MFCGLLWVRFLVVVGVVVLFCVCSVRGLLCFVVLLKGF